MARGRGMPGGAGGLDMGAMMKQVQQMQADMLKAQEELKDEIVEASAGGGMIKVTISGDLELRSVEIDPDAVDPEDVEMLQDMVMAAINEALQGCPGAREQQARRGDGRARRARPAGDVGAAACTRRPSRG